MTPPFDTSPVSHLFVFLTLLFSLWWQKLQPKSYMWSFYSNPVASMSSSVNFPIGCLTKREKTKPKKKRDSGHRVDFVGVRSAPSTKLDPLNDCHWWIVCWDKCFRSIQRAFILLWNVRTEKNNVSNYWGIGKCVSDRSVWRLRPSPLPMDAHGGEAVNSLQKKKTGVRVQRTGHNLPC